MKYKIKIILMIIAVAVLATAVLLSSAFNLKSTKINSSFTENSTYKTEDIVKAAIIQEFVSFKDDSIKTDTILSRISENIEEEVVNIHKEYKAEVLGNATTGMAVATVAAPAESPANLGDYESAVLYLINTIRTSNGLQALQASQVLTNVARSR